MAYIERDALSKREQYERTRSTLWIEKSSFDSQWRELAQFVKPRRLRQYVSDRNRGDRRNLSIVDSTATFAHRTYMSGMLIGMSPPSRPWFKLSTPDPQLAKFAPVKAWLFEVTERMHTVFGKSNLYTALPTMYGDHGLFGTACMGSMPDDKELFRCYPYPIGTYALGVSKRQQVDTFIREYSLSVRQLIDEFGERDMHGQPDWSKFSSTVKTLWDRGEYEQQIEVCWIIAPNPDHDPTKMAARYKPWLSCYFEKGRDGNRVETGLLRESGFDHFPILAPRFEVAAEDTYGTDSCGMTAIGDIKGLQTMKKRKAQAVEKMVNPPLQAPTHMKAIGVTLLPGGINYADSLQQGQGIRPVHEVNMQIDHLRLDIADERDMIRRAFYEDLFLMLAQTDRREITAREIEERHEEKLLALGPVLERTNDEAHEPHIDLTYPRMEAAGMIPEPPADLEGVALKVEYVSILSQAQKMVGVVGLDRFMGNMVNLAPIFPQIRHKIKVFQMVDKYADALGIDPDMILSDDEAEASLQQEQEAAAKQQQAEQAALMAKGARDLSQAPMDNDSALARMVGQ